jgi:hypothetical protein
MQSIFFWKWWVELAEDIKAFTELWIFRRERNGKHR